MPPHVSANCFRGREFSGVPRSFEATKYNCVKSRIRLAYGDCRIAGTRTKQRNVSVRVAPISPRSPEAPSDKTHTALSEDSHTLCALCAAASPAAAGFRLGSQSTATDATHTGSHTRRHRDHLTT